MVRIRITEVGIFSLVFYGDLLAIEDPDPGFPEKPLIWRAIEFAADNDGISTATEDDADAVRIFPNQAARHDTMNYPVGVSTPFSHKGEAGFGRLKNV